jgi:hypothetical protein
MKDNRFLVNLVHGLTRQQAFFIVWFFIAGFFCLLMIAYYRKNTRSNFRRDRAGKKISVDARRIGTDSQNKDLTLKSR